ncbi:MAG TPA: cytochrome-c peroxidase, partial [Solirubrobacteraceae bacterium]
MISGTSRAGLTVSRIALAAVASVFMALSALVGSAEESVTSKPRFSDGEIKIILSHGPWPAPLAHDPTNRVSGKPDAIEFGTLLFFDRRLSGSGTKACGSCHVPERNWTDNLRRGVGTTELDRNTPTLMNVRGQRWYGWDGAA